MARCTRCAIDVADDAERCPKCLRSSTLASATTARATSTSSTGAKIGWGELRRDREAPLGWAPTIMAIGFLGILWFAGWAAKSDVDASSVTRWPSLLALALVYGFKRELDAIGLARTIGVFLTVCLSGAFVIGGSGFLLVFWADRASSPISQALVWVLAIVPSIAFVVGVWWVSRRLDRARHAS